MARRPMRPALAATLALSALCYAVSGPLADQAPPARIAYSTNRDGNYDIYIMNPDGGNPLSVTRTMMDNETHPTWSPDGRQLAFEVDGGKIAIVNLDGSGRREFARGCDPAWSPDGEQIAFCDTRRGNREVHIATLQGETRRLTNTIHDEANPCWSPDGGRLAFQRSRALGPDEVWIINADGSEPYYLVRGVEPAWSPDGQRVAFVSDEYGRLDLYTVRTDGHGLQRLSNDDWIERNPTWSPDGQSIAFSRQATGMEVRFSGAHQGIVSIPTDGGARRRLTLEWRAECIDPAWGPAPAPIPDARPGEASDG